MGITRKSFGFKSAIRSQKITILGNKNNKFNQTRNPRNEDNK